MSLESLTKQLEQQAKFAPKIGYKILVDLGDDGVIFIDGEQHPAVISNEDDGNAVTTMKTSASVFEGIMNGTQDPTMAVMMGKMKITGKMGVAMKLASILED